MLKIPPANRKTAGNASAVGAVCDHTCPNCGGRSVWDPHATPFPVHLLNREPVFTGTSNSPPWQAWQGDATAPQALSGRLANVAKYLSEIGALRGNLYGRCAALNEPPRLRLRREAAPALAKSWPRRGVRYSTRGLGVRPILLFRTALVIHRPYNGTDSNNR